MTEGATSRLFDLLPLKLHRETKWIGINLFERGEHMRLPLYLDHLFILDIQYPHMVCVRGDGGRWTAAATPSRLRGGWAGWPCRRVVIDYFL